MFTPNVVLVGRFSVDCDWFINSMVVPKENRADVFGLRNINIFADRLDIPLLRLE